MVDLGPVEVDDGRARAQLAQGRAHALLEGVGGHVARAAQGRSGQPRAGEARWGDDRAVHTFGPEALEIGGHRLPLGGSRAALHRE